MIEEHSKISIEKEMFNLRTWVPRVPRSAGRDITTAMQGNRPGTSRLAPLEATPFCAIRISVPNSGTSLWLQ